MTHKTHQTLDATAAAPVPAPRRGRRGHGRKIRYENAPKFVKRDICTGKAEVVYGKTLRDYIRGRMAIPVVEVDTLTQPEKKRLTKEQRLELAKSLAGSAKHFTLEGLRESDRIMSREDWEEEAK
ncbi:hypothetical protein NLX67_15470 [Domibacillus sp. A3M-37]|uniref:hypothetical protein n=1 Tax=Domibacillus sp. A3M-37 TaxID=2962037 RepID=UPI0020B67D5A|nr:hypothetical protein [Domibacillus sp. A3M-37]MCP3763773.1 hypothetical protein [Domibacillus sp. A3M-37]